MGVSMSCITRKKLTLNNSIWLAWLAHKIGYEKVYEWPLYRFYGTIEIKSFLKMELQIMLRSSQWPNSKIGGG